MPADPTRTPDAATVTEREWIAGVVLMAEFDALDKGARESIIRTGRELLDRLEVSRG